LDAHFPHFGNLAGHFVDGLGGNADAVRAAERFAADFDEDAPVFGLRDFFHQCPVFLATARPGVNRDWHSSRSSQDLAWKRLVPERASLTPRNLTAKSWARLRLTIMPRPGSRRTKSAKPARFITRRMLGWL